MKPGLLFLTISLPAIVTLILFRDSEREPEPSASLPSSQRELSPRPKIETLDWSPSDLSSRSREELEQLSIDQLKTALKKTKSSSLDFQHRRALEKRLLILIIKANPSSLFLDSDLAKLAEGVRHNWREHAIAEWTRQAPNAATSWLDSLPDDAFPADQLTALRHHHFSSLMIVDFEAAKVRLQVTPKKQRSKMIENYDGFGTYWTDDDFKNHPIIGRFAGLARTFSTAGSNRLIKFVLNVRGAQDRPMGIGMIQRNLKDWDKGHRTWVQPATVADYLQKINATPEEENLCLDEIEAQYRYHQPEGSAATFREDYRQQVKALLQKNE